MFHFMKRGDRSEEKERKKKEEKDKKKSKEKPSKKRLSTEDLNRLEEVRRSYFGRRKPAKRKDEESATTPSGDGCEPNDDSSTASGSPICSPNEVSSGTSNNGGPAFGSDDPLQTQRNGSSKETTSRAVVTSKKPSLPPKPPPKRGILKGTSQYGSSTGRAIEGVKDRNVIDDDLHLVENTMANEVIVYDTPNRSAASRPLPPLPLVRRRTDESSCSSSEAYSSAAESPTKSQSSCHDPSFRLKPGEGLGRNHGLKSYGGLEDDSIPLPPLVVTAQPKPRTLKVARQPGGDFGFCLRRAVADPRQPATASGTESGQRRRESLFAEPKEFSRNNPTGLLPGDRLLEVNAISVVDKTREEVADLIRASDDTVTLVVQLVPELRELTVRSSADGVEEVELDESHIRTGTLTRSGSKRFKKGGGASGAGGTAKSEFQLASEKAFLGNQKVWLVHKGGYAGAALLTGKENNVDVTDVPEGKTKIKLDHNEEIIEVDEEDLEKANPPQFDRVEDLAQLRFLNESGVLHTLRQRFAGSLIHTYASSSMIVVNPMQPLSIYTEKVIQMFKGCKRDDMPPHIYAVAQSAYRNMLTSRTDQSIVLMGRSGSGKSFNFSHVLSYLCHTAGTVNKVLTVEKLRAITTLLECFGHCRTTLNSNATRFTVIFSLDFEHSGQIANASLQTFMLDRDRVVRRPDEEATFKAFYLLLVGMDDKLKKEFYLDGPLKPNLFFSLPFRTEDVQHANLQWIKAQGCLDMLGVKEEESKALWSVLASIYHLSIAGVDIRAGGRYQFANPQAAQRAASLLGTNMEELARYIFHSGGTALVPPTRSTYRTSPTDKGENFLESRPSDAQEALEGMAMGLYSEAFNALVSLMNRAISSSSRTVSSILVLDTPGFKNPASCGRHEGATFEDLCHNYIQERLQLLFHEHTIVAQQDKYTQEHIEYNGDGETNCDTFSPAAIVNLIDKPLQQGLVRTSNLDLRNADQRGLLWLLDEEGIFPGSSDESFVERLFIHNSEQSQHGSLLNKSNHPLHFVIQHMQGTNPVFYNAHGWLKSCRENPNIRAAILLLHDSQKENISKLFVTCRGPVSMTVSGSVVGIEGTSSLRRASSIRRTYTTGTAGIKRKSVCLQVKFQADGIIETLRRSRLHFIHCILPQHNSGLCESKAIGTDGQINVPLVRSQIRGSQVIDAARMNKQGFPDHMSYSEFRRRFELLAPPEHRQSSPILDEKKAAEMLIEHMDIDGTQYKLGLSQIFFRTGALLQLEEQRDDRLQGTIVRFQALCRGQLARKHLLKLKVQDVAIRCIQRNVRKFMAVRSWPWWRLLVKVLPLLNVHRTEEELRQKSEELEVLKSKFEKLEKERTELKYDNNKLEAKVSELTADLAEEHATSTHASEMLEAETSERMRLEKELQGIQTQFVDIQKSHERMEMEVMEVRMLRASEMNGDLSGDEEDGASVYKQRYENIRREMEYTKKKLQQQHEDDNEHHLVAKKSLERKLAEALEECDKQRQTVNQWKRKLQRLTQEMNDVKYLLEEQTVRNGALEKKQRKFDGDLHAAQDNVRQEKLNKERIQREKDQLMGEKYTLEQDIQSMKLEMEMKDEKLEALTRELDDLTFGNKGDEEIAQLKRGKHELQIKMKDQEEELDDLAGQVQMLEQAKLRLEMNLENVRKEYRKELSQKEEEIEETRASCQKKLKILEHQLETEHDERQSLIREKHELERKLSDLQDRPVINHDAETLHRLRKDLKRTKALLKDAHIMLDRSREENPSKSVIRQLKNQLEDAEFARTAAIKARQGAEIELQEAISQAEDTSKVKQELEKKLTVVVREKNELEAHVEENEEEMSEVMRKYKAAVSQLSTDQIQLSELASQVSDLEVERNMLKEQLTDMTGKVEQLEGETVSTHEQKRLELKLKELETRLELEATTRSRLEVQLGRVHENLEKVTEECDLLRLKEQQSVEGSRRLQRQIREHKEDCAVLQQKELEVSQKRRELEMALENAEAENQTIKSDMKLALKRIEDLQAAMEDNEDSDATESGTDNDSSDSSIESFLLSHRSRPSLTRSRFGSSVSSLASVGAGHSFGFADGTDAISLRRNSKQVKAIDGLK